MSNSFDKDVPDSADMEPPLLGLPNYHQDGSYAEYLANFQERSHTDDWSDSSLHLLCTYG
jgi:hypothetical protein